MFSQDIFPVYAQYHEDIILAALLADVHKGFYVDVGANHETYHSVTRYFYDQGWSGINIEPIPRLLKEISDKRTRDINLQLAISTEPGEMNFREYPEHDGLSTLSADSKADPAKQTIPHVDYTIKVEPLRVVFKQHKVDKIDFLKIDVEGYESEVLKSNDWKKYRPVVVAIEANHRADDWSEYLHHQGYERVIFDGLNEYYLDQSMRSKMDGFAERATLLAHNAVRSHHLEQWNTDILRMQELDDMTKRQEARIKHLESEITRIKPHALIDMPYGDRLKVAANSLIIDVIKARLIK